ncbi:helix-turn-helix domain-containing protein [Kiloniella laminariae]|uniref:helix-turn-helix domain-containing protein n=1 Tax=Kiloniella laminariae TaxID=454162 RepID=UPI00037B7A3D|nr:cupin domain-containing protein [Kiloniella laminariae]
MARPKAENTLEEESVTLGQQIRDLRKAKRMSVTSLAEKIGKSVGYISQIERGISAVSIPILNKISEALEVQNSWFFHGTAVADPAEQAHVVRKQNRRKLNFTGTGMIEELLSPDLGGDVEVIMGTFQPGAATGDIQIAREVVEESGYVVSGTIIVEIADKSFTLHAGDSFKINRGEFHRTHNPGPEVAEVIWIMSPPFY